MLDNGTMAVYWSKENFSTIGIGANGHPYAKKMYLDTELTPFTKINPKWIIDLNVKSEIIKLLEHIICINLDVHGYGDTFLGTTKTHIMIDKLQTALWKIMSTEWKNKLLQYSYEPNWNTRSKINTGEDIFQRPIL